MHTHSLTHTHTHTHTLVLPRYGKICITIIVSLYHDILCITIYINEQLAWCSDISQTHRVIQRALKQTGEVHPSWFSSCYSGFSKRKISWSACQQRLGQYRDRKNTAFVSRYCVHIAIYRGNTHTHTHTHTHIQCTIPDKTYCALHLFQSPTHNSPTPIPIK